MPQTDLNLLISVLFWCFASFYLRSVQPQTEGIVDTLAGTKAISGAFDGYGTFSTFNFPQFLAVTRDGATLYVSDTYNHRIRKIDTVTGQTWTVVGSGTPGFLDGTGTSAQIFNPTGLALDPLGETLFFSDRDNYRIRKITTASGRVSSLAGSGGVGLQDGVGTQATFNYPQGLSVDMLGKVLYIADERNHCVRALHLPTGTVSTLAGGGVQGFRDAPGIKALFYSPKDVSIHPHDPTALFVADYGNDLVRLINITTGGTSIYAGQLHPAKEFDEINDIGFVESFVRDGIGTDALFNNPASLVVTYTGEKMFVSDEENERIRTVDLNTGMVSSVVGRYPGTADGTGTNAQFSSPFGLAIPLDNDPLYVVDRRTHRIRKVITQGHRRVNTAEWTMNSPDHQTHDVAYGVTTDINGAAYVTGSTYRGESRQWLQANYSWVTLPDWDMFVRKINAYGTVEWTITSSGNGTAVGHGITIDGGIATPATSPNLTVTGWFDGLSTRFGNHSSEYSASNSSSDMFVLHLSSEDGQVLWVLQGSGGRANRGHAAAAQENTDEIIVVGQFQSPTFTIGFRSLSNYAAGWGDMFMFKVNSQGSVLWMVSGGGDKHDYAEGVAVDLNGDVYITGYFGSTNCAFAGKRLLRLTGGGGLRDSYMIWEVSEDWPDGRRVLRSDYNVFVAKLSGQTGSVVWATEAGGLGLDEGRGITLARDKLDSLSASFMYVVGHWDSPQGALFGDWNFTSRGRADTFLMKMSTSGTVVWATVGGGKGEDVARSVTLDTKGNVFVTGSFSGRATFGSFKLEALNSSAPSQPTTDSDVFVLKVKDSGSHVYAIKSGGTGLDRGYGIVCSGYYAGGHALYITGYFNSLQRYATFGRFTQQRYATYSMENMFVMKMQGWLLH